MNDTLCTICSNMYDAVDGPCPQCVQRGNIDEPKTTDGPRWRFDSNGVEQSQLLLMRDDQDVFWFDGHLDWWPSPADQATILAALNNHKRLLALGKRTVEIITPTRSSIGPDATQMLVTEGQQLGDLFKEWVKAITAAEANDGK